MQIHQHTCSNIYSNAYCSQTQIHTHNVMPSVAVSLYLQHNGQDRRSGTLGLFGGYSFYRTFLNLYMVPIQVVHLSACNHGSYSSVQP